MLTFMLMPTKLKKIFLKLLTLLKIKSIHMQYMFTCK